MAQTKGGKYGNIHGATHNIDCYQSKYNNNGKRGSTIKKLNNENARNNIADTIPGKFAVEI